jgi:hypothetical protein
VDIGCGAAGAWAIEVAKEYPAGNVYGLDLSPVDRTEIPENCHFVVGDVNNGLPFANGSMDLVQSRYNNLRGRVYSRRILMAGVQKNQWSAYVREVFRITKPGTGWVQIIEPSVYLECDDDSVPEDAAVWEVTQSYSIDNSTNATKENIWN